jgi:phosphoribosylamine--glycine ligase
MNVLLLGSGGREHALAWKLKQSKNLNSLFIAPGNAGTASLGQNVPMSATDFSKLKKFSLENNIDMIVVGPEDPLVQGVYDFFLADKEVSHIAVIGPSKIGAKLEGSKNFAKKFMMRHNIPTAQYKSVTASTIDEGCAFLDSLSAPYVLKADGLAAGKGVLIINDLEKAKESLRKMLDGMFGASSRTVVIEEFLSGIECSVFVLTDGKSYKILPVAKDYKRIGESDTGLNTGGMGAISPVPFANEAFMQMVEKQVVIPTVEGLRKENITYKGFIFIGLIKVNGEPKVIEYNVRMGDPETEVVIPRLKSDLLDLFSAVATETLDSKTPEIDPRCATTVMMVSGGYPEHYEKGKVISGIENVENSLVFHAGTSLKNGKIVSSGGRVLAVTSYGKTIEDALSTSYENIEKIHFQNQYYRKDIGFDL